MFYLCTILRSADMSSAYHMFVTKIQLNKKNFFKQFNKLLSHSNLNQGQGCIGSPCGINANCHEALGRPVCSCPIGYSGNPLVHCRRSGCLDHTECASHQTCRNGNCVDPCVNTCGVNANCEVRNHVPVCSCPSKYRGDPFTHCIRADPGLLPQKIYNFNSLA